MSTYENHHIKHREFGKGLFALAFAATFCFGFLAYQKYGSLEHTKHGEALIGQEKYTEAIKELNFAIKLDPGFSVAHYNLGIALYQTGQVNASIKEFRETVRIASYFSSAYYYLGNALNDSGHREEARATWQKVLVLPERPWAKAAQEQLDKYPDVTH